MAAVTISDAAKTEIAERLRTSRCQRPVASLLDGSQAWVMANETAEGLAKANAEEQLAYAMNVYREREASLAFRLEVGVCEAQDCRPEDLVEIDGVAFAMPKEMRDYFDGYGLDYVDERFILKDGHRVFVRLMDLGKESGE